MAKKAAKKRKAARSVAPRGFRGPEPGSKRKSVNTHKVVQSMQKLLDRLNETKSGDPGWGWVDHVEAEKAAFLLGMTITSLSKCDPGQSFPKTHS